MTVLTPEQKLRRAETIRHRREIAWNAAKDARDLADTMWFQFETEREATR